MGSSSVVERLPLEQNVEGPNPSSPAFFGRLFTNEASQWIQLAKLRRHTNS